MHHFLLDISLLWQHSIPERCDIIINDEGGQALKPESRIPILYGQKGRGKSRRVHVVAVGDFSQLPDISHYPPYP